MMLENSDSAELLEKIDEILCRARQQGVDAAEASAHLETGFSVSARERDVDTLLHHQEKSLSITVYLDKKTASVSTSDLSTSALAAALSKALTIVRYTNQDAYAGLAEPESMAYDYPDLDLCHPWAITPQQAIELALECDELACQYSPAIKAAEEVSVETYQAVQVYGNSHGFVGHYPTTRHLMSCVLVATQDSMMERDYDYTVSRNPTTMNTVKELAEHAAKRTVNRLGARKISTRQCPVIFSPEVAKGLVGHLMSAISGGRIYRGMSFLCDQLEQPIFPDFVSIYQRPHLNGAIGSAPYDSEGVKTQDMNFIKDGVLSHYLLSSYSARKLALPTQGNANGPHNLMITNSGKSLTELLKAMDTGLLVTELMGQGVNVMTGNYSRGAFGYWVEHGEIVHPVGGVTIAGQLKDMFANIVAIANDVDQRGNICTGSIWIDQMTVAGNS